MDDEARPAAAPRVDRSKPGELESFGVNAALVEEMVKGDLVTLDRERTSRSSRYE